MNHIFMLWWPFEVPSVRAHRQDTIKFVAGVKNEKLISKRTDEVHFLYFWHWDGTRLASCVASHGEMKYWDLNSCIPIPGWAGPSGPCHAEHFSSGFLLESARDRNNNHIKNIKSQDLGSRLGPSPLVIVPWNDALWSHNSCNDCTRMNNALFSFGSW